MLCNSFIIGLLSIFFGWSVPDSDREIIYARRDGMGLTMTILKPEQPNGKAVVSVLSGGWYSDHALFGLYKDRAQTFVDAGYTVFLAEHASGPRYAIPEALEDIQKAIQYVRYHAAEFDIDPNRIGITGTSSGGHLALLASTSDDVRDASAKDPMSRVSSKVQAVAVFSAPTDFLNYGKDRHSIRKEAAFLKAMRVEGCFRYTRYDEATDAYIAVPEAEMLKIDSLMSPAQLISQDDAPVYISHGDKDDVVPLQQSRHFVSRLEKARVPVALSVVKEAGHGWKDMNNDQKAFVFWFDRFLKK
ncbi:alpha/beta hydrolase [Flavobacterium selenitireducens]|uniref:alpha/beta hydrolase n=1 Tax=Flavobacterium selenitireducens TaxID=2722704 RepID=UPI00168B805A|nr:alpha/beta hydrolase [Flavobacterium selenitireducens]MBD3582633.1 alpha/beta hydrolase [Flavobacterium selenitireducens]